MTSSPAILVFAQDQEVRDTLMGLVQTLVKTHREAGERPIAILIGCRARVAKADLEAALGSSRNSGAPILLITAQGSEELAIDALRAGISNYLRLPLTATELSHALKAMTPAPRRQASEEMAGKSQAIEDMRKYLHRVASFSTHVLITGETGTGKELAAKFVHQHSVRATKPLVTINCAAIPDNLLESELFGFERGSFTGAHAAQDGKLKLADGGTLFLDEIGDLSPCAQAKMLRVLETGEIQRLGGKRPYRIDIRVISATNKDLATEPHFRQDLYFRLNIARVHLPPLRDRREDIIMLADLFRQDFNGRFGCHTTSFTAAARCQLLMYPWPGNIRELRNMVEAAFIDPGPDAAGELALPARFVQACAGTDDEPTRILAALTQTHWNRSRAAEKLHWSRMTLHRKMIRYQIQSAAAAAY